MLGELTHHAYGLAGSSAEAVLTALERMGYQTRGNPDVRLERYNVLGIDEAHALKDAAQRTAVTEGKKVFIVSAQSITREAQNALLKIVEEPPKETHFFLIVPSLALLLPTLRSRLQALSVGASDMHREREAAFAAARSFLGGSAPARQKAVQAMLQELEREKEQKEDASEPLLAKERIMAFLDALECIGAGAVGKNAFALSEILTVKQYSRDRAPSFKLLLEHLALVLPKAK